MLYYIKFWPFTPDINNNDYYGMHISIDWGNALIWPLQILIFEMFWMFSKSILIHKNQLYRIVFNSRISYHKTHRTIHNFIILYIRLWENNKKSILSSLYETHNRSLFHFNCNLSCHKRFLKSTCILYTSIQSSHC